MRILFTLFALMVGLHSGYAAPPVMGEDLIAKDLRINLTTNRLYRLAYSRELGDILIYDIRNVLVAIDMGNGHWRLVRAVRSSSALGYRGTWVPETNIADNESAEREYSKVPTPSDIQEFFELSHWKFEAARGRRLIEGEIFPEAWKKAFGFEPSFSFPDRKIEAGKPASAESIVRSLGYSSETTGFLLATKESMPKDPELKVEEALVLLDLKDGYWKLGHLLRFPSVKIHESWSFTRVYDGPDHPYQTYTHLPTEAEVDAFITLTDWKFGSENGLKLVKGEIYEDTWFKILKFRPKYKFEKIAP